MATQLIIALDLDSLDEVRAATTCLHGLPLWMKVGKQLFTRTGPAVVRLLKEQGHKVFLDLKFHDIPNTTAQAVLSAMDLGADMVNVHASGGSAMIRAAADLSSRAHPQALLIAVTVLTSMDQATLDEVGLGGDPESVARRFALIARKGGAHGVVCSAHEIRAVKEACGSSFLTVVPGIRPAGADLNDQKRVMSPAQAAQAGADFIVVGRPVLQAPDPRQAAIAILRELGHSV